MKIGELAKQTNMSKDTLRYYINEGFILPKWKGSLLDFDQNDLEDIAFVQELKSMGFSLRDIREIMSVKHLLNQCDTQYLNLYLKMLGARADSIHEEIHTLYKRLQKIESESEKIRQLQNGECYETGVPLSALKLLCCPRCHERLRVDNAQIDETGISQGEITCHCGYAAKIENGILVTENKPTTKYDTPDLNRGLYMVMPPDVLDIHQKIYNKIAGELKKFSTAGKVILETNINNAFFIYSYLKEFGDGALYIITDKYQESLQVYKRVIDQLNLKLNILYIADDSTEFPICSDSVDIFVDCMASTTHSLYQKTFLPGEMYPYLKRGGMAVGAFVYFDEGARTHQNISGSYPEYDPEFLYYRTFQARLAESYSQTELKHMGSVTKTPSGRYLFGCHIDGDNWNSAAYTAYKSAEK